jgi:Uma2 family endonuclease
MSLAAPPQRYTPEDLLTMPDGDRYELVDGQLVEREMSMESSWIAGEIAGLLRDFVKSRQLGWVFPEETSFQCFLEEPRRVRKPDTSFFGKSRLPNGPLSEGHCPLAPDLVVEVVSPNDLFYEVEIKVDEWLRAGVPLVWVVNPANRTVLVHRATEPSPQKLTERETLTGDDVLSGFVCGVNELFPPRAASPS